MSFWVFSSFQYFQIGKSKVQIELSVKMKSKNAIELSAIHEMRCKTFSIYAFVVMASDVVDAESKQSTEEIYINQLFKSIFDYISSPFFHSLSSCFAICMANPWRTPRCFAWNTKKKKKKKKTKKFKEGFLGVLARITYFLAWSCFLLFLLL